ncbi:2-(1,2-epoxy-1,2-dihydrophenyl)acetyl-CoA isomerase [Proteiniborus ethanoligenes]|uniref:short-chain-enoyl-CoA hydratase n=1 Tax=Proteiniborus ethanoligenes TaxID=415015 RepID=A0A1H3SEV2_9FIRM|nr:enoyl-CoA hydratase/isomerase family protein [Proteiniborus ethanoligenes]SDZ36125.1 2-(1,2-epoxy-1,2-dihydrophenyl)acetyl-CoA isomerase [Proteiniborus ethanoligenes]
MREKTVIVQIQNAIAKITLNRPASFNSFNNELVNDLLEALKEVKSNDEVRVAILTGNGKAFSAGGDLFYLEQLNNPIEARNFIAKAGELATFIMNIEKPIIAMVNGVAAGAGFNIALACDIIYCSKAAKFTQSFVKVGLVPDCGGLFLLPRVVGLHKAKELMFTADIIDAERAFKMDIVNCVLEENELEEATYKFAQRLADSAPVALGSMKKILNKTYELSLESITEIESNIQTVCMQTIDHKEGVAAFKEKRKPNFKGF